LGAFLTINHSTELTVSSGKICHYIDFIKDWNDWTFKDVNEEQYSWEHMNDHYEWFMKKSNAVYVTLIIWEY
jgi:hypothetical protein